MFPIRFWGDRRNSAKSNDSTAFWGIDHRVFCLAHLLQESISDVSKQKGLGTQGSEPWKDGTALATRSFPDVNIRRLFGCWLPDAIRKGKLAFSASWQGRRFNFWTETKYWRKASWQRIHPFGCFHHWALHRLPFGCSAHLSSRLSASRISFAHDGSRHLFSGRCGVTQIMM